MADVKPSSVEVFGYPDLPPGFERAVFLIDKPQGWTSFDVVRKVRGLLRQVDATPVKHKVGHAGTLDPMATGLLICLVGRATKLMERFMGLPKTYEGVLRLGEVTASFDAETEVTERRPWQHLDRVALERARDAFLGEITQRPPMYSAVKVAGERLYKKARRGEHIEPPLRQVTIDTFALGDWNGADLSFRVHCSKGTYIRSLAHDFGERLGVGAHLIALRRTAIGSYHVDQAWSMEQLETVFHQRQQGP